jgi:anthranilate synthase component 1
MYAPDKQTFIEKAARGNLVPVWRELLADQDTPVSAYERLRAADAETPASCSFLLESVEGGEHIGRFSFLGARPRFIFEGNGTTVRIVDRDGDEEVLEDVDPLSVLRERMAAYQPVPEPALPRFFGGAVGYIGYDAVSRFEPVPLCDAEATGWPDMMFVLTDTILVFDRVTHTLKVVANAYIEGDPGKAYDAAVAQIDAVCEQLATPLPHVLFDAGGEEDDEEPSFKANMTPEAFMGAVEKCKEYIRAGDVIQTVLSQRFEVDEAGDPLDVYRALRSINPSPYMYCLEFGGRSLVGSSPEIHVRCEDGEVEVRPIAGTRPRAADPEEDARLAEELVSDPKERAEHVMLVDLGRNDIGRVCNYGSVKVPELMVIERYSHVMHIVSDVVGRLKPGHDAFDTMRATFPAGTVSGAPKIRAMEIIAELEEARRGPYAGAVGYFSFNGNLDSCITIRTVLMEEGRAYVQAGAGIVADSVPERELEETRNKARGMLKALARSRRYANRRKGEGAS